MRFRATLETEGKTATGFNVPAEVVDALGGGKRPRVNVTINGHTYRSSVATLGGRYMGAASAPRTVRLPVSRAGRRST